MKKPAGKDIIAQWRSAIRLPDSTANVSSLAPDSGLT